MYIIGVIIIMLGIGTACYIKHIPFSFFVDVPTIAVISFTIVGAIVGTSNIKTFFNGCNVLLFPKHAVHDDERVKAVNLFKLLSKAVIMSSFILFIFSIISSVGYYEEPVRVLFSSARGLVALASGITVSLAFFETASLILRNSKK